MRPETIAGRYLVLRAVGRGGMGTVWLCRDTVLGREVAVKQVGLLPGESAPDLARALREARSSAALNHPHVVSVFDAVEADDHIWLVMEYVPGETLSQLIAREGRLDPERVAAIGAQVADGLAAAHARGTVHRDVKPGNILIAGDDAKISDFGIARTEGEEQLTRSGILMGTPLYFSPELARGAEPSPAADVWALGATLYNAVEGRLPVAERSNPIAILTAIAETRPPRPAHAGFLTDAIGRMLDPDPVARWTMADAAHALRRLHEKHRPPGTLANASANATVPTSTPSPDAVPLPPPPPRGRGLRWPLIVGALILLLIAGSAIILLQGGGDPGPTASNNPSTGGRTTGPSTPPSNGKSKRTSRPAPSTVSTTTPTARSGAQSTPPSATGSSPAATGSRARTVADYYAALPGDTRSAWEKLSKDVQRQIGGYDNYVAFWRTIDDVRVDAVSTAGDVVTVHLTYTTGHGKEDETRQLQVKRIDGDWLISKDRGAIPS
ncbi:serine/threonine-protein kinase [Nocardioides sp. AN3]